MDSDDLTYKQARELHRALFAPGNYLFRLRERMIARGFPPDDLLFQDVQRAYEAVVRLANRAHSLSCPGMGRSEKLAR
jgi:hypothetical protein